MRAAPAVALHCTGGTAWRLSRAGLPALAAAAFSLWVLLHLEQEAWPAAAVAVLVGAVSWQRARPRPQALVWDGQVWTVDGQGGRLDVMMDLGTVLLLRLQAVSGSRPRWLAVTSGEAGAAWPALRAAAFSRAGQGPRAAAPPAAAD